MKISSNEVLRYLGYRGAAADERILSLADELISLFSANAVPKSVYSIWDCRIDSSGVCIGGMTVKSENLAGHLAGCGCAALLAATLGTEADTLIRRFNVQDMEKAVIAQAVCAAMIEAYCDSITGKIKNELVLNHAQTQRRKEKKEICKLSLNLRGFAALREVFFREIPLSFYPTARFSPGYGDFDIIHQKDILNMLNCSRIGLALTDGYMLVPSKSVTAVIGFSKEKGHALQRRTVEKCERCRTPCALQTTTPRLRAANRKFDAPLRETMGK